RSRGDLAAGARPARATRRSPTAPRAGPGPTRRTARRAPARGLPRRPGWGDSPRRASPPRSRSPRSLPQMEGQVLQLDREVDVLEPHVLRYFDAARREVEDGPHARGDQPVGD